MPYVTLVVCVECPGLDNRRVPYNFVLLSSFSYPLVKIKIIFIRSVHVSDTLVILQYYEKKYKERNRSITTTVCSDLEFIVLHVSVSIQIIHRALYKCLYKYHLL